MNEKAWNAVEQSAAFGVELHSQIYANLRALAAAAMTAEGCDDDSVQKAGNAINQFEADEVDRQKAESRRLYKLKEADYQKDIHLQLLTGAALNLLPRFNYSSKQFEITKSETLQALADTIVWLNAPHIYGDKQEKTTWDGELKSSKPYYHKYPFYILGYKYSDNSLLIAPPLPALFKLRSSDKLYYPRESENFIQHQSEQPDNRGTLHDYFSVPRIATYIPERKERKQLQRFVQQDVHIFTPEQKAQHYNRKLKHYNFSVDSGISYVSRSGKNDKAAGFKYINRANTFFSEKDNVYETTHYFNDYGVLDLGLVRLTTHFNQGEAYLGMLQFAKNDYLMNYVYAEEQEIRRSAK